MVSVKDGAFQADWHDNVLNCLEAAVRRGLLGMDGHQ